MTTIRHSAYFGILMMVIWLCGCNSRPHDAQHVDALPSIYPDYVDVTIPVGIAPLNFSMSSDEYTSMFVTIEGSKGGTLEAGGDFADMDIDEWHRLLVQNKGGQLKLTVCAEKNGSWTQFRPFTINVSRYTLDDWGITYRRIPPSYNIYSHMGIFERELSTFDEHQLLQNTQAPGMCLNCHTPNRTNPTQYVLHIRGEHGATIVQRNGESELLKAKNDSLGGSMVYPYWHPGGRYCAFSTNKTSQMFHGSGKKRIEVYDSASDVFVYDTEQHTILCDTLVMRKYWAENCPAFSPDGRWLYFVTARRQVYPTDYDKERYSLCRVSFDAATGQLGTEVDTLVSADTLGKSVTWPRPSFDGKYVMYTLVDYGYFSIWHPESDLWMYDLRDDTTSRIDEVNSEQAESYHNWSADSHWFLFTSRRDDGLYSRIYIASVDDNGHATKPFMLPQRNPKRYYTQSFYSYNTPDFTSEPVKLNARETGVRIESDNRVGTVTKTR